MPIFASEVFINVAGMCAGLHYSPTLRTVLRPITQEGSTSWGGFAPTHQPAVPGANARLGWSLTQPQEH